MATDKQEYDRYAKSLWIKVYQDVLERNEDDFIYAKDIANQAVDHYMTMFGADSVVKKNFTTDSNVQKMHDATFVEVPFNLDVDGDVNFIYEKELTIPELYAYCKVSHIDQTRIKRILLEMKAEDE